MLNNVSNYSLGIFIITLLGMILSVKLGQWRAHCRVSEENKHDELKVVLGATLSLLGLLIGFTLSMSITGFNSRQQAEEQEAQTITSAFFRTELLNDLNADKVRDGLQRYTQIRVDTYDTSTSALKVRYREDARLLLKEIWQTVASEAKKSPNPVTASILTAITDLVAAQQKTLADWRHQIPGAAWCLLIAVAMCCHFLIGYSSQPGQVSRLAVWVFPLLISLSFFMVSEIDVPGQGIIRVMPNNLLLVLEQINRM
ncbi:bestrophin-like domain [Aeromonas hydrophila]|uniref:bestrophin-like domain n=1 Tax=Aeromonas hydrophila TaxID=644 RepID=UPI0013036E26|nr:hypothetical protein [Aeromonas hydrophila]QGZ71097.1 DUF4239 domain-containing protein [Aeromonas hydrophila]